MIRTITLSFLALGFLQACDSGGGSGESSNSGTAEELEISDSAFNGVNFNVNGLSGTVIVEAPPASSISSNRPIVFSDPGLVSAIPGQVESIEIGFTISSSLTSVFVSTEELDHHVVFDVPLADTGATQQIIQMQVQVPDADETYCYSVMALDSQELTSDPTMLCLVGSAEPASESARVVYFADFSSNSTLSTLSLDTGEIRVIGRTGIRLTDVAILNGTVYGVTSSSLYTIDPSTGESSFVGRLGASAVNALVGFGDVLYAGNIDGQLLQIDPITATTQVIGDLAGGASSGDLVLTDDSLGLIATIELPSSETDWLMRYDFATGESELIGETGFDLVWGLAFFRNQLLGLTNAGELILINVDTGQGALVDQTRALSAGGAAVDTEFTLIGTPSNQGIEFATFSTLQPPVEGLNWSMSAGREVHQELVSFPGFAFELEDTYAFDINKTLNGNRNAGDGSLVTPVFEGQVVFRDELSGFVLIEHSTALQLDSGEEITPWYSAYSHMNEVPQDLTSVNVNTKLGVLSDKGIEGMGHLHFAIYQPNNSILESIDVANELGSFSDFINEWNDQCSIPFLESQLTPWWSIGGTPCP